MARQTRSGPKAHKSSPRNKGSAPIYPCTQPGLASPLQNRSCFRLPSKHLLSARCWCTDIPGEHAISTPSGELLGATEQKAQMTDRQVNYSSRVSRSQTSSPWSKLSVGGCGEGAASETRKKHKFLYKVRPRC